MKNASPSSRTHRVHGHLEVAALTDPGNVRTANEDAFLVDPTLGLIVVADGMSGHGGGAVASAMTIRSVHGYLSGKQTGITPPAVVSDETMLGDEGDTARTLPTASIGQSGSAIERATGALAFANERVYSINRSYGLPERKGIGSTVAGLFWPSPTNGRAIIFHVGDCRIYRLRNGVMRRLTHDHSASQRWIDEGMQGAPPARNILQRAIGPTASVEADVTTAVLLPGDVLLLCSDGLTTMVPDRDIRTSMDHVAAGTSVESEAVRLVDLAKTNGGRDNITVALATVIM
ncbi:MAG: protein phosphatase 2C domain-containing protein [Alphaproteobacteria bacterium]